MISTEFRKLIKFFEGIKLTAYQCSGNKWTIGWGHTKGVVGGMMITESMAELYLTNDIQDACVQLNGLGLANLPDRWYDVLIDFIFNLGIGNFKKSTLFKRLKENDLESAKRELLKWVYSGGRVTKGLVRRRKAEIAWIEGKSIDEIKEEWHKW